MSSTARQRHLDSLRGIAACVVVLVHWCCVYFPYTVFGSQGGYQMHKGWERLLYTPPLSLGIAGYWAVCIFFVLSGYVLSYQYLGGSASRLKLLMAAAKRPFRLGGIVVLTVLLGGLLWDRGWVWNQEVAKITGSIPYFAEYWQGPFSWPFLLGQIAAFNVFDVARTFNGPLWTIARELEGSLLTYLVLLFIAGWRYRLAALAALFFVFKESEYQAFIFGMIVAHLRRNHSLDHPQPTVRIAAAILFLPALFFSSFPYFTGPETLAGTVYGWMSKPILVNSWSMLGAYLVFLATVFSPDARDLLRLKFLLYLGRISYGIYGIHFLVLGSFSSWLFLQQIPVMNYTLAVASNLVMSFAVIVGIAHLLTKWFDDKVIDVCSWAERRINRFFE